MGEGRNYLQKHVQFYSPLQDNLNGCDPLLFNFVFVGGGGSDTLKGTGVSPLVRFQIALYELNSGHYFCS